jgi:hypothetical protein
VLIRTRAITASAEILKVLNTTSQSIEKLTAEKLSTEKLSIEMFWAKMPPSNIMISRTF